MIQSPNIQTKLLVFRLVQQLQPNTHIKRLKHLFNGTKTLGLFHFTYSSMYFQFICMYNITMLSCSYTKYNQETVKKQKIQRTWTNHVDDMSKWEIAEEYTHSDEDLLPLSHMFCLFSFFWKLNAYKPIDFFRSLNYHR